MAFGPAKLDGDVLAIDVASLFQTGAKAGDVIRKWLRRCTVKKPDYGQWRLLSARCERPCCSGAADKCDEFPSPHWPPLKLQTGHRSLKLACWKRVGRDRADVRFGSKADIRVRPRNVRFTPKSRHWNSAASFRIDRVWS